jgi:DNA-binding transcriptional regulator YdaS (Cro superfamily)
VATQQAARQVLARAAAVVGGTEALAARLDISPRVLKLYLEGHESIPDGLLLRAIDIIVGDLPDSVPAQQAPKTT